MQVKQWGNAYRTTMACVDSYDDRVLCGRLYNPYRSEGIIFHSAMEFLLEMEGLLDDMRFPQSFSAVRAFGDPSERAAASSPAEKLQEGRRATFAMRVLFRQNASWQGSLTWLEEDREESFRSVLELLLLMHSALEPESK